MISNLIMVSGLEVDAGSRCCAINTSKSRIGAVFELLHHLLARDATVPDEQRVAQAKAQLTSALESVDSEGRFQALIHDTLFRNDPLHRTLSGEDAAACDVRRALRLQL